MCREMERLCDERELEVKKETARSLTDMGMPVEQIAQVLKVKVQKVQEWLFCVATTAK